MTKLALVMVGLPARGKTFTARRMSRYLSWLGYQTSVFNVGSYRRERTGGQQPASFFDPDNPQGREARLELAVAALSDMFTWLSAGGEIAIYDATNSTRERRAFVRSECQARGVQVIYIESICNDPQIIDANIRETKTSSPDYAGVDPQSAVRDFRARIAHYEKAYEQVGEDEGAYLKLIDVGRKLEVHRIQGYLPGRLVFFLLNIHIQPRSVWITRHGESAFNVTKCIGGDSELTENGRAYAERLSHFMRDRVPMSSLNVWTSTLRRTVDTAAALSRPFLRLKALDEIDAGVCDGLTYDEVSSRFPEEFAARAKDKFRYRYPRGESYEDVIQRLEPIIIEMERQRDSLLIIGHQAVLRALYAYMMDKPPSECPHIAIPLHTLIELRPTAYGCVETRYELDTDTGVRTR